MAGLDEDWDDEAMGAACDMIGLRHFKGGAETDRTAFVAAGCFFLELAVLYGDARAATHLVNIHNDPVHAARLENCDLHSDSREAWALIREESTRPPYNTARNVMLTYLNDEFGPTKIREQRPNQLEWGLRRLDEFPEASMVTFVDEIHVFARYPNPSKIKLQILEHCLNTRIALPRIPQEELIERREIALYDLARYNDPFACMVLATRQDGPPVYSSEWQRLLTAGAGGGDGHALWLLGIHEMRKEGILPITPDTKAKLGTSLGFEFALLSIMALHEDPSSMVAYTLALAALCRTAGDTSRGFQVLANSMNDALDRPDFPRPAWKWLNDMYADWDLKDPANNAYWGDEKSKPLLTQYFDPHSKNMQIILKHYH